MIQDRIGIVQAKMQNLVSIDTLSQLTSKITDIEKTIADISLDTKKHIPDFIQEWQQEVDALAIKKTKID